MKSLKFSGILDLLLLLFCACTSCVPAIGKETCDLTKLEVGPWKPDDFTKYVGTGATIELSWVNPSPSKPTDQFHEPPLLIRNSTTGNRCEIDGGIWVRDQIYLSTDERTLVLKSYSGSSTHLEFYETAGCKQLADIEVSGPSVVVEKNRVTFDGGCEYDDETKRAGWCVPAAIYALESACKVAFLEKESRALTKKLFGTEFAVFSKIEFPHTPKARIIQARPK